MSFKVKDYYYDQAKKENYLARSVYKLQEIDKKFRILEKGQAVFDLGYYPGSWIQFTSSVVGEKGIVIGIDVKNINRELEKLPGVKLFQKDVFKLSSLSDMEMTGAFDVILSDMAPNTTGVKMVDQARSLELVEATFSLFPKFLKKGGRAVVKIFDGPDVDEFIRAKKREFSSLKTFRPRSTRSVSKEFFIVGKDYQ